MANEDPPIGELFTAIYPDRGEPKDETLSAKYRYNYLFLM